MLVISRKAMESVYIGNDIVIHVVQIRGEHVRLAIEAPKDVKILRHELKESDECVVSRSK